MPTSGHPPPRPQAGQHPGRRRGPSPITDFGLAKRLEGDIEMTASPARSSARPAYMAPEQATGRRGAITTATDVYGLGAVLYALLTGRAPVRRRQRGRNARRGPGRSRPSRPQLNAEVPRDLETICLKCLEKDPRRRYATAQALADDLHAWLDRRPIAARPGWAGRAVSALVPATPGGRRR